MKLSMTTDSAKRKQIPMFNGLFGYFGAALAAVAHHSWRSNEKHNPGQPLHWSIDKSTDHADCIARHLLDLGDMLRALNDAKAGYGDTFDSPSLDDVLYEADALAWRALALNQMIRVNAGLAPMPFNARRSEPEQNPADVAEARAMLGVAGYPATRCSACQQQPCACKHRRKTLGYDGY